MVCYCSENENEYLISYGRTPRNRRVRKRVSAKRVLTKSWRPAENCEQIVKRYLCSLNKRDKYHAGMSEQDPNISLHVSEHVRYHEAL